MHSVQYLRGLSVLGQRKRPKRCCCFVQRQASKRHAGTRREAVTVSKRTEPAAKSLGLRSSATEERSFSDKIVVLSAGAINSAALPLRSAYDKHPNGPGQMDLMVVARHYRGTSIRFDGGMNVRPDSFRKNTF